MTSSLPTTGPQRFAVSIGTGEPLLGLVLYGLLALLVTWPLLKHATTHLVIGTEPASTVPMFNAWTMWWNSDRLLHGFANYWDAPIFYPEQNTFAYSEPQPATVIVAPLTWITESRALAVNVYLWISLALNGWMAERCLRSIGTRRWLSIGGGAAMLMLPIVHWQIGVIQLVPMWGTIWLWWAVARLCQQSPDATSRKRYVMLGIEIGLAMTCTWYCCIHHGLSLGLLMLAGGWVLGFRLLRPKTLVAISVATLLFALTSGPLIYHMAKLASNEEFRRTEENVAALSTLPGDYLNTYGHSLFRAPNLNGRAGWMMSPGLVTCGLAIIGAACGMRAQKRPLSLLLIVITLTSFLLSLGDNLQIGTWKPWWLLAEYLPGIAQVRNVFRFGYFFQAAVVLLATLGLDCIWSFLRRPALINQSGIHSKLLQIALVGLALITWFDPWPPSPGLTPLYANESTGDVLGDEEWAILLATRASEREGVLCLPMSAGSRVTDYQITARWMIASTHHHRPLANGYSGFFPKSYFSLRDTIKKSGMDEGVLDYLTANDIAWVVIDRRLYSTWWGQQQRIGQTSVTRVSGDGSSIDLYHLETDSKQ